TKVKTDKGKAVVIPKGSAVTVTEVKDAGGAKYANVQDWGWTKFSNLGTGAAAVKGGYEAKSGSTVFGVGRPSMVDYEDGHDHAQERLRAHLLDADGAHRVGRALAGLLLGGGELDVAAGVHGQDLVQLAARGVDQGAPLVPAAGDVVVTDELQAVVVGEQLDL